MASGRQLSDGIHKLLMQIEQRTGMTVPESARTTGQIRSIDAKGQQGKRDANGLMRAIRLRQGGPDVIGPEEAEPAGHLRQERNHATDLENQGRENIDPASDSLDALYSEISSRTKDTARPGSKTQFTRSSPETERKQVAYRQSDERKALASRPEPTPGQNSIPRGDPYKVDETHYADDVPNLDEDQRYVDAKGQVDDSNELVRLIKSGKMAGGEKDLITALAQRGASQSQLAKLVREQHVEGQRFSDLQPGRRGPSIGSSEGTAIDNQAALDHQALAEYLSSMRSGE